MAYNLKVGTLDWRDNMYKETHRTRTKISTQTEMPHIYETFKKDQELEINRAYQAGGLMTEAGSWQHFQLNVASKVDHGSVSSWTRCNCNAVRAFRASAGSKFGFH